jgi:hypothetical protein
MIYQERANELIKKFNDIYPNIDWTDIAIKNINDLLLSSNDSNYIEYWNNIKTIIINRNK